MQLSVIIPVYNEAAVLAETVSEVSRHLMNYMPGTHEIIIVDDGSTDDGVAVLPVVDSPVVVIRHRLNRGKGSALRSGVARARGDYFLMMDADNSTRIFELDHFWSQRTGTAILIGSRALHSSKIELSQSIWKKWLGRLGNVLIQMVLLPGIHDSRCGFKLFPIDVRSIFARLKHERFSFDDEVLFLAKKKGYRLRELPVVWTNNFDSKVRTIDYFTTIIDLFRVRLDYILGKYKL